jgi:hypothetical protein
MPANDSLLLIERFNVAPSADGEWTKYAADGLLPAVGKATGTDVRARYRFVPQPEPITGPVGDYLNTPPDLEEWNPHVHRVYRYTNLYEIKRDNLAAVIAAGREADEVWSSQHSDPSSAYGIRVAYESYGGILPISEMPDLWYVTRYNIPESRRAAWEENYAENHKLDTENATGRPGIGRATCYRMVGTPHYVNWWGPSDSYQYFNIYELVDEKTGIESSFLSRTKIQADLGKEVPPPTPDQLTGLRAVYEKLR